MLKAILKEKRHPAEKLMRSRYSAYVRQEASYLVATTHSSERESILKRISAWARSNDWQKLSTTMNFLLCLKMRAGFKCEMVTLINFY
jgi:SEC-C motif-containing protein